MSKGNVRLILLFGAFCLVCGLFLLRSSFRTGTPERIHVNQCKVGLQQVNGAKEMWAADNNKTTNDTPSWADLVGPDRYLARVPYCNRGGNYSIGRVGQSSRCSIATHNL